MGTSSLSLAIVRAASYLQKLGAATKPVCGRQVAFRVALRFARSASVCLSVCLCVFVCVKDGWESGHCF